MAHKGDLQYFIEAVFNYPTLGEAYKYAAFDALVQMRERREGNVWPFERPTSRSKVP
jgi:NAD(P) transhydrogenase